MTNNELLLAISDLLDVKLKAQLQPLKNELHDEMQDMKDELRAEMHSIRDELRTEMQDMKNELRVEMYAIRDELRTEMYAIRDELRAEMHFIRDELRADNQGLDTRIRRLELNQENIIIPRLNDIESCYTDTFKRYRDYADKIESTYEDVELLKKVVMDHSEKLQKLA